MAQTQLSERLGSSGSIFDTKEDPKVRYSKFNYSMKHNTTLDIGGIYPLDLFEVYPGDQVKLSVRYLLDTLPLAVPPMNNYRVQVHYYHINKNSLWKGWDSFITKGASGIVDKKIPSSDTWNTRCLPSSLAAYFGVPIDSVSNDYTKFPAYIPWSSDLGYATNPNWLDTIAPFSRLNGPQTFSCLINLMPFMFYQKIYRDSYAPIDLLRDCLVFYPEDLSDEWRIDYSSSNVNKSFEFKPSGTPNGGKSSTVPTSTDVVVGLDKFRYAQFDMDYFTSAKPWLVRGLESQLNSVVSLSDLGLDYNGSAVIDFTNSVSESGASGSDFPGIKLNPITTSDANIHMDSSVGGNIITARSNLIGALNKANITLPPLSSNQTVNGSLSITANTLRNLLAISVWQERNALAHGRYNSFVKAHWGLSPKHPDYEPRYLGGTSTVVSFGQVLQTSETTSTSPLGKQAGIGSCNGGSYIFKEHFNDHGYIMGVMIISPEVYYSQGISRMFTDLDFDSQYQPEFARLGFEPILNQEIFLQGKKGAGFDNDLFGYTTRSSWLKMRLNRVSGMLALPPQSDALFSAYSQSRYFTSLPKLSAEFVTMLPQNIRRDFLAYPTLPAFRCQFASDVELIRALPYQSLPETFGF